MEPIQILNHLPSETDRDIADLNRLIERHPALANRLSAILSEVRSPRTAEIESYTDYRYNARRYRGKIARGQDWRPCCAYGSHASYESAADCIRLSMDAENRSAVPFRYSR